MSRALFFSPKLSVFLPSSCAQGGGTRNGQRSRSAGADEVPLSCPDPAPRAAVRWLHILKERPRASRRHSTSAVSDSGTSRGSACSLGEKTVRAVGRAGEDGVGYHQPRSALRAFVEPCLATGATGCLVPSNDSVLPDRGCVSAGELERRSAGRVPGFSCVQVLATPMQGARSSRKFPSSARQ